MPIVIPERYKPFNDILFFVAVSDIKLKFAEFLYYRLILFDILF